MLDNTYFRKDDGRLLPVSDNYLLPFLSPTSPGTNYWDSPPPGPLTDRQRGRVLLQLHQALELFQKAHISLKDKKLLDIGTGNGMIPRLLLEFSDLQAAVGADPFLNDEHKTSWQGHDQDQEFCQLRDFIKSTCKETLDCSQYQHFLGYEHFSLRPDPVPFQAQPTKHYRFAQIGAHDLAQLDEQFDIFYIKAIDHIPNWERIFRAISSIAKADSIICIKHFSFFSYLGPHRYATTNIPWGHVLLTDTEYRRFANEFHGKRADHMIDFYFKGLAYPRKTMSDLVRMAKKHNFIMRAIINEPLRNLGQFQEFTEDVECFWDIANENWPNLSSEEMMSGRYHILLQRA